MCTSPLAPTLAVLEEVADLVKGREKVALRLARPDEVLRLHSQPEATDRARHVRRIGGDPERGKRLFRDLCQELAPFAQAVTDAPADERLRVAHSGQLLEHAHVAVGEVASVEGHRAAPFRG